MASIVFNIALGRIAHYASLPAASDGLVLIPLESSGREDDDVLRDADTFTAVVAGTTNEQTTLGREALTDVTVTVNDTDNRVDIDCADVTWTAPAGNPFGAVVVCDDPDTTGGTDSDLVPLTKHDLAWVPDGIDLTLTIGDFCRASSAS